MKNAFCIIGVLLFAFISMNTSANIFCVGKIDLVMVGDWDGVYVKPDWLEKKMRVCDLDGGFSTAPGHICEKWLASLQAAQVSGATVAFWYNGYEDGKACSTIPPQSQSVSPTSIYFFSPGYNGTVEP